MSVVVHDTPGLIDVRAFTTFGVNVKPAVASPIGTFGTGLKYAVAVLVRMGAEVTVWIGERPHVFFTEKSTMRGKEFDLVRMRRQRGVTARWFAEDLPFTTELGKFWEPWMALRELHSNTLDEDGESYAWRNWDNEENFPEAPKGVPGRTRIVVRSPAYAEAFADIGSVFMPGVDRSLTEGVTSVDGRSEFAFYRGLRAHRLQKPSVRTWCMHAFLELTEDRSVKHGFYVDHRVRAAVMASEDRDLVRQVLDAPDGTWEHTLNWAEMVGSPASEVFREEASSRRGSVGRWYASTRPPAPRHTLDWRLQILSVMDREPEEIGRVCHEHKWRLKSMLRTSLRADGHQLDDEADAEIPF